VDEIENSVRDTLTTETLKLGLDKGKARAWLFEQGVVDADIQHDDGYEMTVTWTGIQKERFKKL